VDFGMVCSIILMSKIDEIKEEIGWLKVWL
jgi:hypothetical protein